jgi:hypothetical protein
MTVQQNWLNIMGMVFTAAALGLAAWALFTLDEQGERVQQLERPPTREERVAAAEEALRQCGQTPSCRRQFLLVLRASAVKDASEKIVERLERVITRAIRRALVPQKGGDALSGGGNNPPNNPPGSP